MADLDYPTVQMFFGALPMTSQPPASPDPGNWPGYGAPPAPALSPQDKAVIGLVMGALTVCALFVGAWAGSGLLESRHEALCERALAAASAADSLALAQEPYRCDAEAPTDGR